MTTTATPPHTQSPARPLRPRGPGAIGAFVAIIGVFAIVALIMVTRPTTDYEPTSINNPDPAGAMAIGEIAAAQGVDIRQIRQLARARIVDPEQTTLIVASTPFLTDLQAQSIAAYPGPIVIIGSSSDVLRTLDVDLYYGSGVAGLRDASCALETAVGAGTISTQGGTYYGEPPRRAEACYPNGEGYTVVSFERQGKAEVTLLADAGLLTNAHLAEEGNAALGLRLIGQQPNAVWYVGDLFDTSELSWLDPTDPTDVDFTREPTLDVFPPGTGNAIYALIVALIVVVWWRARRFGPLVREQLPVVIRSSESTLGRARLYRRAGATGRAGASLRAAAALRMGRRLGLSRSDSKGSLVTAVARASGRPVDAVEALLYGALPLTETQLMSLATEIDTLEGEVHRP